MKNLIRYLVALSLLSSPVFAQGSGQLQSGQVWGNSTAAQAPASGNTVQAMLNRAGLTSLAINGCVIGSNVFCTTGTSALGATTITGSFTATGLVTYADMATAALATSGQYIAGTASTLVPSNIAYTTETTTTYGTTTTFDFSTFINTAVTLTGNITTMTLSNIKAGQSGQIRFIQDGSGSRTTVWSSTFKFASGSAPVLTTTPGAVDALEYTCISTSYCVASLILNVH
jgi:hypothetical protein